MKRRVIDNKIRYLEVMQNNKPTHFKRVKDKLGFHLNCKDCARTTNSFQLSTIFNRDFDCRIQKTRTKCHLILVFLSSDSLVARTSRVLYSNEEDRGQQKAATRGSWSIWRNLIRDLPSPDFRILSFWQTTTLVFNIRLLRSLVVTKMELSNEITSVHFR